MDRMSHSGRLWRSHAQGRCSIDGCCQQRSNEHRSRALFSLTRPRKCSMGAIHTVYDRRGASMARATACSTVGPAPSYGPGSSIWIVYVLWYVNRARIRPTTYLLHIVTRTSNVYESDCMQSPDEERGRLTGVGYTRRCSRKHAWAWPDAVGRGPRPVEGAVPRSRPLLFHVAVHRTALAGCSADQSATALAGLFSHHLLSRVHNH